MIYGETHDDYLHRKMSWHRWFAWRPVPLFQEGRWTWLRHLERRAVINPFWHYGPDLFSPPYWFEYRLPEGR